MSVWPRQPADAGRKASFFDDQPHSSKTTKKQSPLLMWADERDPSFSLDMMEILQGLQEEVTHALKAKVAKTDIPGPSLPTDAIEFTLPTLAENGETGLGNVPKDVLEKCLQPVMRGLENMDAKALLEMKEVQYGASLKPGVFVEGIHNSIEPHQEEGTVRYIHITEVPGQFTMGIFVFPPYGRIPLHDHPEMCVMSRVLYGDLDRLSLDLVHEEKVNATAGAGSSSTPTSILKSAWSACRFGAATLPPPGAKRAFRNRVDHLVAPACTALYPYEGNLHEFVAGPHGAAVLDVLLPPYDAKGGRDCTFYHIRDDNNMGLIDGRQPCWIVPTGQPEDFHCITGWYGGLGLTGESEEFQEDGEEKMMM